LSQRVSELRRMGFRFAMDHIHFLDAGHANLVAQIEVIQIVLPPPPQVLILNPEQLRIYRTGQKKLFARQVQNFDQLAHCLQMGFDYFSGHFYAKPIYQDNRKFSASEMTILKALDLLNQDADDSKIEQVIKQDAVIGINILKHVNSAGAGMPQRIGSLKQAIQIIGHAQLQRWLQVLLYEKPGQQPSGAALFTLATTRGKLLELLAKKQLPHSRNAADIGFIVGLMSLMDTLFALPMAAVLEKVPVYNEVKLALLERKGVYGELLQLIEYLEHLADPHPDLLTRMDALKLSIEDLYDLQQQAFVWVNQLQ
jgi:c-di-GMP phosphodiesterase